MSVFPSLRVSELRSRNYLLNGSTFCNQTWCGGALLVTSQTVVHKKGVAVSKVKVTVKVNVISVTVSTVFSELIILLQQN